MNDRDVLQFLIMYKPINEEMETKWFEEIIRRDDEIFFSIMKKNSNRPLKLIGNISLTVDHNNQLGKLGILIGEKDEWEKTMAPMPLV